MGLSDTNLSQMKPGEPARVVDIAYGARGRTSLFAAVAVGVFSMREQLYIAAYSHIDSEGGVLYRDCSKTVIRSRLYSNTASQVNIKIKYRIFL